MDGTGIPVPYRTVREISRTVAKLFLTHCSAVNQRKSNKNRPSIGVKLLEDGSGAMGRRDGAGTEMERYDGRSSSKAFGFCAIIFMAKS
jgi:hypothetical protein